MPLQPGDRLGPYEVLSAIGAGGMGEVYRARDTKLGRDVAIKVLPDVFADDPERLARFHREAQVLASLNHPHIAAIYGLEESAGVRSLIMEFVDGATLADRIDHGPIPWGEARSMATQMAEALLAAHDQGIVHRDLKPANIKVRDDGTIKVLDFGLAKLVTGETASTAPSAMAAVSQSPTLTSPVGTIAGTILGTAAYMSPEQAKGRAADKRSDVWAFGCVLYEMLTGRRAFEGNDVSEVLASVLAREPRLDALPATVPSSVRALLTGCLEKERKQRIADVSTALFVLRDPGATTVPVPVTAESQQKPPRHEWRWKALAGSAVGLLLMTVPFAVAHWREQVPEPRASRFNLELPENSSFNTQNIPVIAVSPNGRYVAFTALRSGPGPTTSQLWLRPLDSLEARPLAATENGVAPFWSPDSREIGFYARGQLKRIDIATGTVQTIAQLGSEFGLIGPLGFSWSPGGTILMGGTALGTSRLRPIQRISVNGGESVVATSDDGALHAQPMFLPDGRHFLFAKLGSERPQTNGLYVGSLDSTDIQRIGDDATQAQYASGMLLFVRGRSLLAQPFDAQRLSTTGEPTVVADGVLLGENSGRAAFSASTDGVLAFFNGELGVSQLTWLTRDGQTTGVLGTPASYYTMSISSDGRAVVYGKTDPSRFSRNLWTTDLMRGVTTRITFGPNTDSDGTWSPTHDRIVYASVRRDGKNLYENPSVGGTERLLLKDPDGRQLSVDDWSPDGRTVLFHIDATTELRALSLDDMKSTLVVKPAVGRVDEPTFSPDGKWIAYNSEESGQFEVYVVPFPVTGARWQISAGGGVQPHWRRDGRELFFLAPDGAMMATDITLAAKPEFGSPRALFRTGLAANGTIDQYDVMPDGQRFLIMNPIGSRPDPMTVVLDWPALVRRK